MADSTFAYRANLIPRGLSLVKIHQRRCFIIPWPRIYLRLHSLSRCLTSLEQRASRFFTPTFIIPRRSRCSVYRSRVIRGRNDSRITFLYRCSFDIRGISRTLFGKTKFIEIIFPFSPISFYVYNSFGFERAYGYSEMLL